MTDRVDPELRKILTRLLLENSMQVPDERFSLDDLMRKAEDTIRDAKVARAAADPWAGLVDLNPDGPRYGESFSEWHKRKREKDAESVAITSTVLSLAEVEAVLSALYAMRVELLREQRKASDGGGYRELLATNDAAIRKLNGLRLPSGGHVSFED